MSSLYVNSRQETKSYTTIQSHRWTRKRQMLAQNKIIAYLRLLWKVTSDFWHRNGTCNGCKCGDRFILSKVNSRLYCRPTSLSRFVDRFVSFHKGHSFRSLHHDSLRFWKDHHTRSISSLCWSSDLKRRFHRRWWYTRYLHNAEQRQESYILL